jgi:hypothetical protein
MWEPLLRAKNSFLITTGNRFYCKLATEVGIAITGNSPPIGHLEIGRIANVSASPCQGVSLS